jgi:hypothetical protein
MRFGELLPPISPDLNGYTRFPDRTKWFLEIEVQLTELIFRLLDQPSALISKLEISKNPGAATILLLPLLKSG